MAEMQTSLPIYQKSIDWTTFFDIYPVPDVFEQTVYQWPRETLHKFQNQRFMQLVETGWRNKFYSRRWRAAGVKPEDVRSIDDIAKLPSYTSDDVKTDQAEHPLSAISMVAGANCSRPRL